MKNCKSLLSYEAMPPSVRELYNAIQLAVEDSSKVYFGQRENTLGEQVCNAFNQYLGEQGLDIIFEYKILTVQMNRVYNQDSVIKTFVECIRSINQQKIHTTDQ